MHRRLNKALSENDNRYREFLDNLSDIAYKTDVFGNVTYANKIAEIIIGVPLRDIIGKPFLPYLAEESRPAKPGEHYLQRLHPQRRPAPLPGRRRYPPDALRQHDCREQWRKLRRYLQPDEDV